MKFWKKMLLAGMMLFVIGSATQVVAVDPVTVDDRVPGYENIWQCMAHKLGRGISNTAFGVLEVPLQIAKVQFEDGGIAAITYGVLQGVGYCVARELVGVLEIVTFPVPLPYCPNDPVDAGPGYGPIMEPEWIITPETNYYNFVYQKNNAM